MQENSDIEFNQLVQAVKRLPKKQWFKLKKEIENQNPEDEISELTAFLMTAPTFSKQQLETISEAKKSIDQWKMN